MFLRIRVGESFVSAGLSVDRARGASFGIFDVNFAPGFVVEGALGSAGTEVGLLALLDDVVNSSPQVWFERFWVWSDELVESSALEGSGDDAVANSRRELFGELAESGGLAGGWVLVSFLDDSAQYV